MQPYFFILRGRQYIFVIDKWPTKRPPEGGLSIFDLRFDQAASIAFLRRRYVIAPTPAKPRIIMAQVESSGTAVVTDAEMSTGPKIVAPVVNPTVFWSQEDTPVQLELAKVKRNPVPVTKLPPTTSGMT
jgi:hypothetical protein